MQNKNQHQKKWGKGNKTITFSSDSSMSSSLNFSLPPFLRILSQKVASNSALELPATPLLQKTSKASLRALGNSNTSEEQQQVIQMAKQLSPMHHTLWKREWFMKQSFTYAKYLSCSSITFLTKTCRPDNRFNYHHYKLFFQIEHEVPADLPLFFLERKPKFNQKKGTVRKIPVLASQQYLFSLPVKKIIVSKNSFLQVNSGKHDFSVNIRSGSSPDPSCYTRALTHLIQILCMIGQNNTCIASFLGDFVAYSWEEIYCNLEKRFIVIHY